MKPLHQFNENSRFGFALNPKDPTHTAPQKVSWPPAPAGDIVAAEPQEPEPDSVWAEHDPEPEPDSVDEPQVDAPQETRTDLYREVGMNSDPAGGNGAGSPAAPPQPSKAGKARGRVRQSADSRVVRLEDETLNEDPVGDVDPQPPGPSILVIDRVGELSNQIGRAVAGLDPEPQVLHLNRSTLLVEAVAGRDPYVLVLASDEVTQASMRRLAQIHRSNPKVVILLSETDRQWTAAQIAASGASDILPPSPTRVRLKSKLTTALAKAEELRSQQTVVTERIVIQEAPVPAPAPANISPSPLGKVFTVTSATGGSGKTFMAANLATYLVKTTGLKVLLVDLDLQFGEIATSLHLHPKRSIDDLVKEEGDLGPLLAEHLIEHKAGFKALCSPTDPLAGEWIGPDDITRVLDAARQQFDFVVVDSPPTLSETCLAAFDQSEGLLILANMDVPSVKNMRRFIDTLEILKVPKTELGLVLNRADPGTGIEISEVQPLFPQGFLAVLPTSKLVCWSINMGEPLLQDKPESEFSQLLARGFAKMVPPADDSALPWASTPQNHRRSIFKGRRKGNGA